MTPRLTNGALAASSEASVDSETISGLIKDDVNRFRVHSSVYIDPTLFNLEIQRIFERSWIFVAHEEMIPECGNYITTSLGKQPIIVSRGSDGDIHVLFNRCAHRGSVVCREERGHSDVFRCPYHGWVFANNGQLVGAAQRSGYPEDFLDWDLRLEPVPRVDMYRGLIFANLDPATPPLSERLEGVRSYIDLWCERSPKGTLRLPEGVQRYEFPANWKLQAENGVDGYHGNYVHESFVELLERSGERSADRTTKARNTVGAVNFAKGLPCGDGLLEREEGMLGTFDYRSREDYREKLETAYGVKRADDIMMQRNIFIFPNLFLFESHIRVIHPVRADKSYIDVHPTYLRGAGDVLNAERLSQHECFFGPSGFGAPDDIEIFACFQSGAAASGSPWLEFSRGMHRETTNNEGETVGHSTDETPQRSLYREWLRRMLNNGSHEGSLQ